MLITRVTKIGLCLCLGLFGLLVAYDNVVDYGANYGAIGHVLSMDTTFTRDVLRDRAITNPHLWRLAYAAIIAAEALTGILLLIGAGRMSVALRASEDTFQRAKAFAIAGCGLGLLTWLFGFMIIAGEWFAMWRVATLERATAELPPLRDLAVGADLSRHARRRAGERSGVKRRQEKAEP